jgi:hypothetical protein
LHALELLGHLGLVLVPLRLFSVELCLLRCSFADTRACTMKERMPRVAVAISAIESAEMPLSCSRRGPAVHCFIAASGRPSCQEDVRGQTSGASAPSNKGASGSFTIRLSFARAPSEMPEATSPTIISAHSSACNARRSLSHSPSPASSSRAVRASAIDSGLATRLRRKAVARRSGAAVSDASSEDAVHTCMVKMHMASTTMAPGGAIVCQSQKLLQSCCLLRDSVQPLTVTDYLTFQPCDCDGVIQMSGVSGRACHG